MRNLTSNIHQITLCIAIFAFYPIHTSAKTNNPSDKIDHLALASILFKDGHIQRAQRILQQINTQHLNKNPAQYAKYHTLWALILLKQQKYLDTIPHLEKITLIPSHKTPPSIYLLLAQSYFHTQQFDNTLLALQKAPSLAKTLNAYTLHSHALWKLNKFSEAHLSLSNARKDFPHDLSLQRTHILLLIQLHLYQTAQQFAQQCLKHPQIQPNDFLTIAEALRNARQLHPAALILERALLLFPQHEHILVQLAKIYLDDQKILVAAQLLERAAKINPKYLLDSAELYRRSSHFWAATYLNSQILDQTKKIRQRLAILLDTRRFSTIATMTSRLSRLNLLQDQDIIYALAFSFFRIGSFKYAEQWLKQIHNPTLFQRATLIRQAIQRCQLQPDTCL